MSMRIHKPRILAVNTGPAPMGPLGTKSANAPSAGDNWASRIAKMIPAEAIVFYSTLLPYVKGNEVGLISIAVLGWVVAMVVRHFGMKEKNKDKPQMGALVVATGAYVLWLTTLPAGQWLYGFKEGYEFVPMVLTLAWVTLVPYFYKGE